MTRWLVPFAVLFIATSARAHQLYIFASVDGKTIKGNVYFRGNTPAQNVTVKALDAAGSPLGETTTDQQGDFRLEARYRCDHRLLADTGDGHGADPFTVTAAQLPADLPSRGEAPAAAARVKGDSPIFVDTKIGTVPSAAAPEANVDARAPGNEQLEGLRAEIVELRKEIREYKERVRLQDILGGIGFIVGITGVAYYYLGVRRKKSPTNH